MANEYKDIQAAKNTNGEKVVEVLYQKLGNRWYAFSLINEEVFVGSLSQEEIDAAAPVTQAPPAPAGHS